MNAKVYVLINSLHQVSKLLPAASVYSLGVGGPPVPLTFICQWLKAQQTTAYSPGSSMTSQPTNFFTARLLWASRRPKVSLLPLPNDARNTMMHRSSRWLSAVSERLQRSREIPFKWGEKTTPRGGEGGLWEDYLLPSWNRANSRAVLSSTVRAVTVTGPLALLGK